MKVLVLGSGAREHALADALRRGGAEVLVAPGNDGMRDTARTVAVPLHDLEALADLAASEDVALTVAGSEEPLVRGVWDVFDARGLRLVGPSAAAAALEGSKVFAKRFMQRHGIPTAGFQVHDDFETACRALEARPMPVVVKADGLAAGKGVHMAATREEAETSLHAMLVERRYGDAGRRVVVEDTLEGPELSVFALCDGYSFRIIGTARDHKRAFDGDQGPNTGGMGACAPIAMTPSLRATIESQVLAPVLAGMVDEGMPYRGFLYAGLMLTAEGPRVLEFNCRLGDPEAQVLLPCLRTDLLQLLTAADQGDVGAVPIEFEPGAAVGVVVASPGYPEAPRLGIPIAGLDAARATGVRLYYGGVRERDGRLVTHGGRICTVVGQGADLEAARQAAYAAVQHIRIEGAFHRNDIGHVVQQEGTVWPNRASAF